MSSDSSSRLTRPEGPLRDGFSEFGYQVGYPWQLGVGTDFSYTSSGSANSQHRCATVGIVGKRRVGGADPSRQGRKAPPDGAGAPPWRSVALSLTPMRGNLHP